MKFMYTAAKQYIVVIDLNYHWLKIYLTFTGLMYTNILANLISTCILCGQGCRCCW